MVLFQNHYMYILSLYHITINNNNLCGCVVESQHNNLLKEQIKVEFSQIVPVAAKRRPRNDKKGKTWQKANHKLSYLSLKTV